MSASPTREIIKQKKRARRKRRNLRVYRLFVMLALMGAAIYGIWLLFSLAFGWAGSTYDNYNQLHSAYEDRRMTREAVYDPQFKDYTNILLLGLDDGREVTGQQVDTLVLLSLDNKTGDVRLLNIPRYTLTPILGQQPPQRINNAYYYGGVDLVQKSVEDMLGVTVHDYMAITPGVMAKLVDAIGGVELYVESDMNYDDPGSGLSIHLGKGYQRLNGEMAQKYLRFTSDSLGSLGRVKRQQHFLKALYAKITSPEIVTRLPEIISICEQDADSSIERFDLPKLVRLMTKLSGKAPVMDNLPGAFSSDGQGSWVMDSNGWSDMRNKLFPNTGDAAPDQN